MGDFVSQVALDQGLQPVPDALGHDATALAILKKAAFLPEGSVLAVQGSWGRGKTDVLTRVAAMVRAPDKWGMPKGLVADALWINPWQYGTPDLLTPLVLAMLNRMPPEPRRNDKRLRVIAETLLRAGLNFGLKTVGKAVPILSLATDPVDRMIAGLFEAAGVEAESDRPDPDPVSVMGERFRELGQKLLEAKQAQKDARILICVDDLDRCLPDRQVALLEAIRFLISSGAPVTFLIALDPTLARQAIITHYQTEAFDPDRYLDKMFDLRVNLPSIGPRIGSLVRHHLEREMRVMGHVVKLGDAMNDLLGSGDAGVRLEKAALKALSVPDLANPRIVRRIFDRLYLLAISRSTDLGPDGKTKHRPLGLQGEREYRQILVWLGITERFPGIRAAVQAAAESADVDKRLVVLHQAYTIVASASAEEKAEREGVIALHRLPTPKDAPELAEIFGVLGPKDGGKWTDLIRQLDEALVGAGL